MAKNDVGDAVRFLWCFEVGSVDLQNLLEVCTPIEFITEEVLDLPMEWETSS